MPHPLHEYVLIDTETTGFGPAAQLVEVAALHVRDGASVRTYHSLARPSVSIPWQASQVHGITNAMVRNAPAEAEVAQALRAFIGGLPLVAHNASFDARVLRGAFERAGVALPGAVVWCTLKLSRRFVSEAPSHALGALARHLSLATTPTHRAMSDALTTQALLAVILDRASARQLNATGPSAVL
ncbi:MAG: 3'-5' exonuclease [Polyangiales bacterium]